MSTQKRNILDYLDSLKIDKALNGYLYLIEAMEIGLEDKKKLKSISEVYRILAETHDTTINSIERSIAYSLSALGTSNKSFIVNAVLNIDARYGDNYDIA